MKARSTKDAEAQASTQEEKEEEQHAMRQVGHESLNA
jgi:hypothetical protein